MFINFAKNQTDGTGEDVPNTPRELENEPPYYDEDVGPRASFVRLSDYTPGPVDVEV